MHTGKGVYLIQQGLFLLCNIHFSYISQLQTQYSILPMEKPKEWLDHTWPLF